MLPSSGGSLFHPLKHDGDLISLRQSQAMHHARAIRDRTRLVAVFADSQINRITQSGLDSSVLNASKFTPLLLIKLGSVPRANSISLKMPAPIDFWVTLIRAVGDVLAPCVMAIAYTRNPLAIIQRIEKLADGLVHEERFEPSGHKANFWREQDPEIHELIRKTLMSMF